MKTEICEKNGIGFIVGQAHYCRLLIVGWIAVLSMFHYLTAYSENGEYRKVLTDGKMWKANLRRPSFSKVKTYFTVTIAGDTTVYDLNAKKLLVEYIEYYYLDGLENPPRISKGYFYDVAAEQNGVVWCHNINNEFVKAMDVKLNLGDKFEIQFNKPDSLGVSQVTHIDYCDTPLGRLKRIFLNESEWWIGGHQVFVEGVGFLSDCYTQIYTDDASEIWVTECYDNGQLIFSEKDFMISVIGVDEISDNPKQNIKYDPCQVTYDIFGNVIQNPIPRTVVIQNGKKFIVP